MKTLRIIQIALWSAIALVLTGILCWMLAGHSFGWRISNWNLSPSLATVKVLDRTVDAQSVGAVDTDLKSADVVYSTGASDSIRVACYADSTGDKNEFSVTQSDGTLHIAQAGSAWGFHLFGSVARRVEVQLPASWRGSLTHKSLSGDVRVPAGLTLSSLNLSLASGDITSLGGSGTLTADTVHVSTLSGDIRLSGVNSKSYDIHSTSGDVTAGSLAGTGTLGTTSGDVSATLSRMDGSVAVSSVSGDVRLTLAAGVGAKVDARSVSGNISSAAGLTFTGSDLFDRHNASGQVGSAPYQPLTISTTSGDIRLK